MVAFAVVLGSVGAAGCSSSSGTSLVPDAGGRPDAKLPDSGPKDVVLEALRPFDGRVPLPDASSGTGTLLQAGYDLLLSGVTSDGAVIYSNAGEVPTFFAAPLAGGAAVNLGLSAGTSDAIVAGEVAFVFTNIALDPETYESPLFIYSLKHGQHTLTTSSFFLNAATSSDGKYVLYLANFNASFQTGDLYVASSDGTGVTLLQTGVPGLAPGGMNVPNFAFSGTTAILAYYPTTASTSVTIESFAPPSWAPIPLAGSPTGDASTAPPPATSVQFGTEPTGTYLSFTTAAGLYVAPLSGGSPPVLIDATGVQGAFTTDGTDGGANVALLYATSTNDLVRSPVTIPTPTNVLVTGGVGGVFGLTPDNGTALLWDQIKSPLTDLHSASASVAGLLTTYSSSVSTLLPGDGFVAGDAFTTDSSHVLFFTNAMQNSEGEVSGALQVSAIGSSAAPTQLSAISTTVWAATGAKVVYDLNVNLGDPTTLDIQSIDVTSGAPTTIVQQATGGNAGFFLSPAKTSIIYSWTAPGTENGGIFVAPVP